MTRFPARPAYLVLGLAWWGVAAAAPAAPAVVGVWPANDAACPDTPLRLTFSGPVTPGKHGRIVVYRARDRTPADTIDPGASAFVNTFGGQRLHEEPILTDGKQAIVRLHTHSLQYGESYFVRVDPGAFQDQDGNDVPGVTDDSRWRFTVKPAPEKVGPRLVVAADGSGDFCTVQGAVDQAPANSSSVTEIYVREGVHDGLIRVPRGKDRIRLVGEDRRRTVLTGLNNDRLNPGSRARALLGVDANDFVLENLTVRNRTPYGGSQAEALRIDGERCVVRGADLLSFQDTLELTGRVYVADCTVEGSVDFIWGYGSAFFEKCEIRAVRPGTLRLGPQPPGQAGLRFRRLHAGGGAGGGQVLAGPDRDPTLPGQPGRLSPLPDGPPGPPRRLAGDRGGRQRLAVPGVPEHRPDGKTPGRQPPSSRVQTAHARAGRRAVRPRQGAGRS